MTNFNCHIVFPPRNYFIFLRAAPAPKPTLMSPCQSQSQGDLRDPFGICFKARFLCLPQQRQSNVGIVDKSQDAPSLWNFNTHILRNPN